MHYRQHKNVFSLHILIVMHNNTKANLLYVGNKLVSDSETKHTVLYSADQTICLK